MELERSPRDIFGPAGLRIGTLPDLNLHSVPKPTGFAATGCLHGARASGHRGLRMFGAASPTLTENDVLKIATHLVKSSGKKPSTKWTVLAEKPQPLCAGESPWTDGYRLAQEWSAKTGIRHKRDGAVDVEEHLERLGVTFSDIELDAAATAGLAVQPAQGAPYIFVNRRNPRCEFPSGKRVILAHELCHLLHDRAHGRDLAMISGPYRWSDGAFRDALRFPSALKMLADEFENLYSAHDPSAMEFAIPQGKTAGAFLG